MGYEQYQIDTMEDERIAFEENGLRNLEYALLAKQDFSSQEERQQALGEFYELAARLRAVHQSIRAGRQARLN